MYSLFIGCELWEVDSDGNVAFPAFLIEALGHEPGPAELLLSKHEADSCLVGYGRDHLRDLRRYVERRRRADEAFGRDVGSHYRRIRRIFGMIEAMPRAERTLRIPPAMRRLGRIGELALFVGAGDSFEIWNPELALESGDPGFRDLAELRLRARERRH